VRKNEKINNLLALSIAAVFYHSMAMAAPSASSVVVTNNTTNPVPVKSTTRAIYSSGLITSSLSSIPIDVSSCSQIRVTTEIEKVGSAHVSLWDETSGPDAVGTRLLDIPLDDLNPYASQVLDAPGTTLALYLTVQAGTTMATTIYCR